MSTFAVTPRALFVSRAPASIHRGGIVLTLVVPVSLAVLSPSAAELHCAPARGTELRKTFAEHTSWSLKSAERIVGGQPHGEQVPAMTCQQERKLVALDRYLAIEDGVPTKLAREL